MAGREAETEGTWRGPWRGVGGEGAAPRPCVVRLKVACMSHEGVMWRYRKPSTPLPLLTPKHSSANPAPHPPAAAATALHPRLQVIVMGIPTVERAVITKEKGDK